MCGILFTVHLQNEAKVIRAHKWDSQALFVQRCTASPLFVAYEQTSDFLTVMINRLPGQGVSTEVCNLQSPAELNALRDLRNVCRRK